MDLPAYHRALNLGFSESEASRIGDDAWENNRQQPTCDSEPEPDYYDVLVAENTRLRAELAECRLAMSCVRDLSEIVRMPNVEHVADAHNAAVKRLRAALAAKGDE